MTRQHQPDQPADRRSNADAVIYTALRSVGTAMPADGLQGRILNRLAAERIGRGETRELAPAGSLLLARLRRLTRATAPAVCGLSACLVAAVIVAGSVIHSHKVHANPGVAPPFLSLPAHGLGAASAVHPAAPASTPAPPGQAGRGRSAKSAGQGRARIAPHAHKAAGVAVPAPDSQK